MIDDGLITWLFAGLDIKPITEGAVSDLWARKRRKIDLRATEVGMHGKLVQMGSFVGIFLEKLEARVT